MAKPLPKLVIPPAAASKTTPKASYAQLRSLWIQAGGDPNIASTMAAIALAESGGKIGVTSPKNKNGTVDRGLWQINSSHGYDAAQLTTDPLFNARAAVSIYNSQGLGAWTTFNTGAYQPFLRAQTPDEKAAQAAADAQAKAANPAYVQATTDLSVVKSQALAAAKATAHISDPWIVVQRRGNKIVGLGESTGENPPANVLKIGGMPATNSMYQQAWSNVYASDYAAYTGNQATPAVQVDILQRGISAYTLREELSRQPGFVSSPIYKANGPGIADQAKQVLGTAAPPDLVRQAIAQGWDAATFQAHLRASPQYVKGPEFRNNLAENQTTYQSIYGTADAEAQGWLKHATLQGWSPTAVGQALRSDPAYKYSPEFQAKAVGFLDAMGAITGTHPVAGPAMPEAVAQQTARSKVGGVAPAPLQVSTVGG